MAALTFAACESPTDGEDEAYTVTAAANITNGRIIAAPEKAAPGTEITLVLIPNVYYSLAGAPEATLADGTVVALTQKAETEPYTFVMPAANVTVSAGFVLNAAHNDIPLYDAAGLAKIGVDPTHPMNGVYKLEADFAVTDWMPIGEFPGKPFTGILRGNNHTITINSFSAEGLAKQAVGLFGYTAFAEMEDLNIAANFDGDIALTYDKGTLASSFVGYGSAVGISLNMTAKNIKVEGTADIVIASPGTELWVGGIIGMMHSGRIENCAVDMEIGANNSVNDSIIGGIVGEIYNFNSTLLSSGVSITECRFAGAAKATAIDYSYAGGILGYVTGIDVIIQQCAVADGISIEAEKIVGGSSTAYISAGGIAGRIIGSGPVGSAIRNCTVGEGLITATGAGGGSLSVFSGGIAGYLSRTGNIYGCASAVDVEVLFDGSSSSTTLDIMAGGIAGYNEINMTNCVASGDILAHNMGTITGAHRLLAGGITGTNKGPISSCYATGSVEGLLSGTAVISSARYDWVYAGGITGLVDGNTSMSNTYITEPGITDCYYAGDEVKATGNYATAGGIAGATTTLVPTIVKSYARGKVSVKGTGELISTNRYGSNNIGKTYSAGGIVGHMQSPSSAITNSGNTHKTANCVALNDAISSEGVESELIFAGRIAGNNQGLGSPASNPGASGISEKNRANSAMTIAKIITGGGATGPAPIADAADDPENTTDGLGVSIPPAQTVYTSLGWDFTEVWKMGAGNYPVLAWQN
jgi:hypothetical protein